MSHRPLVALVVTAVLSGCSSKTSEPAMEAPTPIAPPAPSFSVEPPEAWSLFGEPLERSPLSPERRELLDANLAAALADFDANPTDGDAIIWVGRRLAYLGRFREAIATFTRGLEDDPESHKLLRHRGHRFISIRRTSAALTDLSRAAQIVQRRGIPDEVEPDGMPNEMNIPRSTSHTNIYYHLGLAHYLSGDFEAAQRAYETCISYSLNDDMIVATSYWLYLTLRRLGRDAEAHTVLETVDSQMDVIENVAYLRLLLLFKGQFTVDEVLGGEGGTAIDEASTGYGVGAWYLVNGEIEQAEVVFRRVVQGRSWAAFGFIAAEAELWRRANEVMGP